MDNHGSQIGFRAALWGSCCGPAIFKQLICNSWRRVIFHLFLLTLCVAFVIAAAATLRAGKEIDSMCAVLTGEFGNISCGPQGIAPTRNPATPRSLALPQDGRLVYLPDWKKGANYSPDDLKAFRYLLFWTPQRQLFAANQGDGLGWAVLSRDGLDDMDQHIYSAAEFSDFLKKPFSDSDEWEKMPVFTQSFTFWAKFLYWTLAIILFTGYFIGMVWLTLLYIGIFALMFRLTGGAGRLVSMTFSQFCKVGVYAAFPAMLVAGCFPVLELPLLSFNTVYMFGLVIYWLVIVNRNEMDYRKNEGEFPNE